MVADVDPVGMQGGAERMLHEYARGCAAHGDDVVVLTRGQNPQAKAEEMYAGYRVVRHPVQAGPAPVLMRSVLREGGRTARRLLQEGFDVVDIEQPLEGAAVLAAVRAHGVPIVYSFHSPWGDEYWTRLRSPGSAWHRVNKHLRERMERRVVHAAERVIVLSEFSLHQLIETHGVDLARIAHISAAWTRIAFIPFRIASLCASSLTFRSGRACCSRCGIWYPVWGWRTWWGPCSSFRA